MAQCCRSLARQGVEVTPTAGGQVTGDGSGPVPAGTPPAPARRPAQAAAEFWFRLGVEGAVVRPPQRFAYAYRLGLWTAGLRQGGGAARKRKLQPALGQLFRSWRLG
jgi:hypothetical protein